MQSDQPFSVIDMYFTLLHAERREEFALDVDDPYVREFCLEIARMDDETVRPLLKRIKSWVENSVIRRIIAHRESTIDFRDIIDNDRIVIVRTPVENTDIKKMVTLGVMRNLWSAIQQRSYERDTDPDPYFVLCDEFDDIASDNLDIESMLARARSMRLSVTLSSQYPSQFGEDTRKAMQNNCDNLIAFSVNDVDDAQLLMKRFRDYTAEDLISTDQYQAWTKLPLEGGRYSEPVLLRTFPPYPPLRSADSVDDIIEASLDRYGTDPLTDAEIMQNLIYSDANEAANPTQILDKTMAGRFVPFKSERTPARQTAGWTSSPSTRNSTRLENSQAEIDYEYEDLPDVRDASRLIDVELQDGEIVARLSDDGETEVQPETGTAARSAGGMSHDAVLMDTETALTERGFSVDILEQDGASNPTPPRRTQTTTWCSTSRPRRRRLTDPRKSCRTSNERTTQIASRSSSSALAILRPSGRRDSRIFSRRRCCERADGTEQFYNCDEIVTFGGGATAHGGVTAVRPRTADTNRTVWTRDDGERVLSDGETEFARVPDEGALSKDGVPAYYSYDHETGQYTVHKPGETRVFDSKDEFKAEWTPIKRPFIPDVELPDADYSRDSYVVLLLPEDGAPTVFQQGESYTLSESPDEGGLVAGRPHQ